MALLDLQRPPRRYDEDMAETALAEASSLPAKAVEYLRTNGRKMFKYFFVAGIGAPVGIAVYWLFLEKSSLNDPASQAAATGVMVFPNYMINRYFVWGKKSKNSLTREVLPFWVMAFIGFVVSTIAAWFASRQGAGTLLLLFVSLVSFGTVSLFKFFVLERYLFGSDSDAVPVGS